MDIIIKMVNVLNVIQDVNYVQILMYVYNVWIIIFNMVQNVIVNIQKKI